jgi:hypothetical protein
VSRGFTAYKAVLFFNWDEDGLIPRHRGDGVEDLDEVQLEAACSLVEMARDGVRKKTFHSQGRQMTIEVRGESEPLLQVKFTFEAPRPAQ